MVSIFIMNWLICIHYPVVSVFITRPFVSCFTEYYLYLFTGKNSKIVTWRCAVILDMSYVSSNSHCVLKIYLVPCVKTFIIHGFRISVMLVQYLCFGLWYSLFGFVHVFPSLVTVRFPSSADAFIKNLRGTCYIIRSSAGALFDIIPLIT